MVEIRRPKKSYDEHRKEFAAARGVEASVGKPEPAPSGTGSTAVEKPREEAPSEAPPPASASSRPTSPADGTVRLKFTVHAPLPGAFAYFDRAVALMGEGEALRLVLARAFDQLEGAVAEGEEVSRATYPVDPARSTNTSRHVSAALYDRAKAGLDPMELLPPGSFGRELAMAALERCLTRAQ